MRRFHHVANGTSLTGVIEAAGIPGRRSVWCDVLYEGPVPGHLGDDELLDVRARFLSDGTEPDFERTARGLREWRRVIADTTSYDELVLWFEHDLFDQLNLVQLLSWIDDRLPRAKPVSLVGRNAFAGRPAFKGFGELTPAELAPLIDTRVELTDAQYALAARAWSAFRQDTPEPLDALRHEDISALPFLGAALGRFLEDYPWHTDGLTRTERRALQIAGEGPIAVAEAFPRMHDDERTYYVTDGTLASIVTALASGDEPLLELADGPAWQDGRLRGTIAITDHGRRALQRPSAERLERIDRWMGGVHLQPGRLWVWDADQGRVRTP